MIGTDMSQVYETTWLYSTNHNLIHSKSQLNDRWHLLHPSGSNPRFLWLYDDDSSFDVDL